MAKHPAKRRFRRYLRGSVDESLAIGTLAAKDVAGLAFDETVNERTLLTSIDAIYSLSNWTNGVGIGPILVGVAHSDYSSAEVEEYLENTGSWNEGDLIGQEMAKRKIRRIGIFEAASAVDEEVVLNDGKPIHTKLNWVLLQGQSVLLWAYNLGTAAVTATVPVIHVEGAAHLWPL